MTQVPSDKPTPPSRAEATGLAAIGRSLEDQVRHMRKADDEAYKRNAPPPPHDNEGLPHFVSLARKLADALIQNAEAQVTRAENNLQEIKRWADNMQAEAQHKWEEQQDLERKFEDYRSYLLQANDRFNGGK